MEGKNSIQSGHYVHVQEKSRAPANYNLQFCPPPLKIAGENVGEGPSPFGGRQSPQSPRVGPRAPFNHPSSSPTGFRHRFPYQPEGPFVGHRGGGSRHPYSRPMRQQRYHPYHQGFRSDNSNPMLQGGRSEPPWMTPELLKMVQDKDEIWNRYNENRTEENYRNFKIKRFEVNMAVNDAKILYFTQHPDSDSPAQQTQRQYNPHRTVPYSHHSPRPHPTASRHFHDKTFYCDACDKTCGSEVLLEEHMAEHITCKLDGCTYTAHAKLVMKHIELQHSTNLFSRIKGYDTPEDIQKWREERVKNFPTPENIIRKKAELAERKLRGESLTAKEDFPGIENFRHKILQDQKMPVYHGGGAYQSDGDEDFNPSKMQRYRHNVPPLHSMNKSPVVALLNFYTDVSVAESGELVGFTREVWANHNGHDECVPHTLNSEEACEKQELELAITDDESDVQTHHEETQAKIPLPTPTLELVEGCTVQTHLPQNKVHDGAANLTSCTNQLGLLVAYDSSDSEDGEIRSDPEEIEACKASLALSSIPEKVQDRICPSASSDEEGPDEIAAIVKKEEDEVVNADNPGSSSHLERFKGLANADVVQPKKTDHSSFHHHAKRVRRKYTLLQRLLAPDIRKEKNIVLQAIRFIVDNNFLEPQDKTEDVIAEGDKSCVDTSTEALAQND